MRRTTLLSFSLVVALAAGSAGCWAAFWQSSPNAPAHAGGGPALGGSGGGGDGGAAQAGQRQSREPALRVPREGTPPRRQ